MFQKYRRASRWLAVLTAFALVVAACAGDDEDEQTTAPPPADAPAAPADAPEAPPEAPEPPPAPPAAVAEGFSHDFDWGTFTLNADTAAKAAAGEELNIVVGVSGTAIPIFGAAVRTGMERACEAAQSRIDVDCQLVGPAQPSVVDHVAMLEARLAAGDVDCLALQSHPPEGLVDLVNDYIAAGVPVFTYNTDIEASNRFAFFALQEVAAASINGRVTAELVQAQGLDIHQVAMGSGLPNDQWARQRMEGFHKGFTEVFPDADFFNDVDSGLPTGENFTTQEVLDSVGPFMLANPDVNLFFHTDQGVEGVGQVIQNQGRVGEAWTSGFNVSDPILDLIDAGAILVTVDQGFDNQSELATTACVDLLADGELPESERPELNPIVITRDGGEGRESTDDARARYAALDAGAPADEAEPSEPDFSLEFDWGTFTLNGDTASKIMAGEELNIVVGVSGTAIPIFGAAVRTGMERACEAAQSRIDVDCQLVGPAQPSVVDHVAMLEARLAAGDVDCLALQSHPPEGLVDLVNDYIAAGVPVFTYNTDIEASNRFAFFALQEVAAASINGRVTAELVQAQGLDIHQVAMGSGLPNDQWARQRMEGFHAGFTEVFPDADFFNDVDSGLPTGENFTTQEVLDSVGPFMLANPDVNLFFHTDQGVEGVGQVIQNQGRVGEAWTSGFNVSDPILDLIDAGAILVTVDQGFDNQSELATTACVDLLADGELPESERPELNPIVITRDGGEGRESTDDARARYAALDG